MRHLAAIFLLMFALGTSAAQAQEFIAYRDSVPDGYNFWLSVPAGYDTLSADLPVLIFLHGRSLCGKDLYRVQRYGPLDAIKRGRDIPALVIAPQNPGSAWVPRKVDNVLEWVMERFNGDRNRIYVYGMSLGGYGTLDYAGTYPDKVAAAMGLCGGTTLVSCEGLRHVPLWIIHGTADKAVSIAHSKSVVKSINQFGEAPLLYFDWMQDYDHAALARFFYLPETYEWLFSHTLDDRKLSEPFQLNWTVMSGAYRNWNSVNKNKVIVSDPPRKDFHPVRKTRHIPDSLILPPVIFPTGTYSPLPAYQGTSSSGQN